MRNPIPFVAITALLALASCHSEMASETAVAFSMSDTMMARCGLTQ